MADAPFKSWQVLSLDGKTVLDLDVMADAAFLIYKVPYDPTTVADAVAQVKAAIEELHRQICPATKLIATDTLTCDWQPDHQQNFHHDPRGVFWTFS